MSPTIIALVLVLYFGILFFISFLTSKNANNDSFFIGNRKSPWPLVAVAMIGTSISGVTFVSVPGEVGNSQFSYLQMVLGFLLGYWVVANVLLPVYYKKHLTSIYTYLEERFGVVSYKTGAVFFLISRLIGSAFRLFLMASVLQYVMFNAWHIPFEVTVAVTILLIWLYTYKGGIRTIVWTDTLQAVFMITALILTILAIKNAMGWNFSQMVGEIRHSNYSRIWFFDNPKEKTFFFKQFLSGAFITIVMTGLDQDMMQKNLSCRSLADAKKNMYWYSAAFVPINFLFLSLGAMLYIFASQNNITIPVKTDQLFPMLASQGYLPGIVALLFIVGLVAAAYSTADSALTALTTSFSIDILNIEKRGLTDQQKIKWRKWAHIGISIFTGVIIIVFNKLNNSSVISAIYTIAGYTYGPLLGLFAFGLFTKFQLRDKWVWFVALISPVLCGFISYFVPLIFDGYKCGYELLIINGGITFVGLLVLRKKIKCPTQPT
jgi:solute:Na+ symporter, SSS family